MVVKILKARVDDHVPDRETEPTQDLSYIQALIPVIGVNTSGNVIIAWQLSWMPLLGGLLDRIDVDRGTVLNMRIGSNYIALEDEDRFAVFNSDDEAVLRYRSGEYTNLGGWQGLQILNFLQREAGDVIAAAITNVTELSNTAKLDNRARLAALNINETNSITPSERALFDKVNSEGLSDLTSAEVDSLLKRLPAGTETLPNVDPYGNDQVGEVVNGTVKRISRLTSLIDGPITGGFESGNTFVSLSFSGGDNPGEHTISLVDRFGNKILLDTTGSTARDIVSGVLPIDPEGTFEHSFPISTFIEERFVRTVGDSIINTHRNDEYLNYSDPVPPIEVKRVIVRVGSFKDPTAQGFFTVTESPLPESQKDAWVVTNPTSADRANQKIVYEGLQLSLKSGILLPRYPKKVLGYTIDGAEHDPFTTVNTSDVFKPAAALTTSYQTYSGSSDRNPVLSPFFSNAQKDQALRSFFSGHLDYGMLEDGGWIGVNDVDLSELTNISLRYGYSNFTTQVIYEKRFRGPTDIEESPVRVLFEIYRSTGRVWVQCGIKMRVTRQGEVTATVTTREQLTRGINEWSGYRRVNPRISSRILVHNVETYHTRIRRADGTFTRWTEVSLTDPEKPFKSSDTTWYAKWVGQITGEPDFIVDNQYHESNTYKPNVLVRERSGQVVLRTSTDLSIAGPNESATPTNNMVCYGIPRIDGLIPIVPVGSFVYRNLVRDQGEVYTAVVVSDS